MSTIGDIIGFNLIVIGPTLVLVATALILLFCTITIETSVFIKQSITLMGILATIFTVFLKFGLFFTDGVSSYFSEKILLDEFSLFGNVLISLILLFNFTSIWNTSAEVKDKTTEAIILTLMSASGFMLMIDAENFMMLFIGLEIGSISLYALAGINRGDLLSNEAALKYFLLGSLASCVLVYGVALIYISLSISGFYDTAIAISYIGPPNVPLTTFIGFLLLVVGLLFKVAAAPFQSWAPDVYQGSPTGITALIATGVKITMVLITVRFSTVHPEILETTWHPALLTMSSFSIIGGNLFALVQTNLKRMLAYSTIANIGFILIAISLGNQQSYQASMFYTVSYVIMTMAAFGVLLLITLDKKPIELIRRRLAARLRGVRYLKSKRSH